MISIPNLPTDNLYKFTFLGGLTLVIVSAVLLFTKWTDLYTNVEDLDFAVKKTKIELTFLKEDRAYIKSQINKITKELKITDSIDIVTNLRVLREQLLRDRNLREFYAFVWDHRLDLLPYEDDIRKLKAMNESNKLLDRKIRTTNEMYFIKLKALSKETNLMLIFSVLNILLMAIGVLMARHGYFRWYYLVQKPADEKLNIELQLLRKSLADHVNDNKQPT